MERVVPCSLAARNRMERGDWWVALVDSMEMSALTVLELSSL